MHQAVAAERDEIRLRIAPPAQRGGPLLRPADVEDQLARFDHAAVDRSGDHLAYLIGHHRGHSFVEQPHPVDRPALGDERPPLNVARERDQIAVPEPPAQLRGLARDRLGASPVALQRAQQRGGHEQEAALRAIPVLVLEQAQAARDPATGGCRLAAVDEDEDDPPGARHRPSPLAAAQQRLVRPLPHRDALVVPADEIRRRGEPLELFGLQRRGPVCGG
jgi:hypothetical protein